MNKIIPHRIKLLLLLLCILPFNLFAQGSLGDAAENLMGPTSIVMKIVDIACYIIGLVFVMMSIAQYRNHRQNPKLVPLGTPITLVILGIILVMIPYMTKQAETGKDEIKHETKESPLPLPGQEPKGAGLPYPPGTHEQEQHQEQDMPMPQEEATPEAPPAEGGGSWTSDPRYNR